MELTAAQKLIQDQIVKLDAKIEKLEARCERGVEKSRETAAAHAEKMTRARWSAKLAPLRSEAEELRAALPPEA